MTDRILIVGGRCPVCGASHAATDTCAGFTGLITTDKTLTERQARKLKRRWLLLPRAHDGPCLWWNHPTHRARHWLVYLMGRAGI